GKSALMSGRTLQKAFVPRPAQATAVYSSSGLDHSRHSDWLGSARLTSSPSRSVTSTTAYAPFGETYASSGTPDPSFTGMNPDTVSTDYDFLYREYSTQGRWPSPDAAGLAAVDPSDPRSWNRYAYVLNNPLALVDPLGLHNDCGGPCTPFSYVDDAGCVVTVTYHTDKDGYDIPEVTTDCSCPGGYFLFGPGGVRCDWRQNWDASVPDRILSHLRDRSSNSSGLLGGSTAEIVSDPNGKKNYCSHQADQAALEDLLP